MALATMALASCVSWSLLCVTRLLPWTWTTRELVVFLWSRGSLAHWCPGFLVCRYGGTVVRWYGGTVVLWYRIVPMLRCVRLHLDLGEGRESGRLRRIFRPLWRVGAGYRLLEAVPRRCPGVGTVVGTGGGCRFSVTSESAVFLFQLSDPFFCLYP